MNRDYKGLLVSFVEIIVFLFAAFGGFLKGIAPPEQSGAQYTVGILSFLALILLLIVAAVARSAPGERYQRGWIMAGLLAFAFALPASYLYPRSLSEYTWWYPPDKPVQRLRGLDTDFTPAVKEFIKSNPIESGPQRLARNFDLDQIWTRDSLERVGSKLTVLYAWLVLSLATSVFCLLEANSSEKRSSLQAEPPPGSDDSKTKDTEGSSNQRTMEDATEASSAAETDRCA